MGQAIIASVVVQTVRQQVKSCNYSCQQELVKHTTDTMEKANLKLALDAMKVSVHASEVFISMLAVKMVVHNYISWKR